MIPPRLHARLDAASAAALLLLPSALQWPARLVRPLALAGLGVAAYSLATRYREDADGGGIDLDQHRMIDAAQGAASLAARLDALTDFRAVCHPAARASPCRACAAGPYPYGS
mgnify:CR=1 FL=1